jgi:threonine dehydratase
MKIKEEEFFIPKDIKEIINFHTPYESYNLKNKTIDVKRDDLFFDRRIAPVGKMRGVYRKLNDLNEDGFNTVGWFLFKVAIGGVGISSMCNLMGMRYIECYPHYKIYDKDGIPKQQIKSKKYGADLYPIKASRVNINRAIAKNYVESQGGFMFPPGLALDETLEAIHDEVIHDCDVIAQYDHIVVCLGSGTILTGIITALNKLRLYPKIHGICCTNKTTHCKRLYKYIDSVEENVVEKFGLKIVASDIEFYDPCEDYCPFPSHPNYDRKAWRWLRNNVQELDGKILFWNIGA